MSWFWGLSKKTDDATSKLDPSLRDFLDKETARTQADASSSQSSSTHRPSNQPSQEYSSKLGLDVPGLNHIDQNRPRQEDRARVPSQSQFQDGRYAELWKTYRSPEEIAAASMTDQDKLNTVLDNFKNRKAAIGRAAIENCVVEQLEQHNCFVNGSFRDLATMCNKQSRAFNRCYEMQARFLKALGYLSMPRTAEEEERIQAHADKLYQEMLERERMSKEAAERGKPVPPQAPLIDGEQITKALGEDSAFARMRSEAKARAELSQMSGLSEEAKKKLQAKIKGLSEEERALELQLAAAELRVARELGEQMKDMWEGEVQSRRKRREEGRETIGDKIKRYSNWQQ